MGRCHNYWDEGVTASGVGDDELKKHIRSARLFAECSGGAAVAFAPSSVRNASRAVVGMEEFFGWAFVPHRLRAKQSRAPAAASAPRALLPPPSARMPRAGGCWLVAA